MGLGYLIVNLFVANHALPVKNAKILVKDTKGNIIYELESNVNGITNKVPINTPDKRYYKNTTTTIPNHSLVDVEVPSNYGYKETIIHGVQIFDGETSILPIELHPKIMGESTKEDIEETFIPIQHGADVARGMQKEINSPNIINIQQTILANEVEIPEFITVHLGAPDSTAKNLRVLFVDYIKNVASSEIYPNWTEAAIYANIYAQVSFALNRIFTVWYRSRGKDFDITNDIQFDQYFIPNRNIFENINNIVDGIFNNFIRRMGREEPFIAQYCDGVKTKCNGLYQWESEELGLKGFTPIQILKYYYPEDIQIVASINFTTNIGIFKGTNLKEGDSSEDIRNMQIYLNRISGNFYIPQIQNPNGYFGPDTKNTVIEFQKINNLHADGIIGKSTWYEIIRIYVAVTRLAELNSQGMTIGLGLTPPTVVIREGSRGGDVSKLQFLLNFISDFYHEVPFVVEDSVFREATTKAVIEFQRWFGLTPDGIVGPATWRKLYDVYNSIENTVENSITQTTASTQSTLNTVSSLSINTPQYNGNVLKIGSHGNETLFIQKCLNSISETFPIIHSLDEDGIFGHLTQSSVIIFQKLFELNPDGIVGPITWNQIFSVNDKLSNITVPKVPDYSLYFGSSGNDVSVIQNYINFISKNYILNLTIKVDGIFGSETQKAIIAFQKLFGLSTDGIIARNTWNQIVSVFNKININT